MVKFEKVSRFKDVDLPLPARATAASAGYDFVVAEDVVIPPFDFLKTKVQDSVFEGNRHNDYYGFITPFRLEEFAELTKNLKSKITLVSTGMKCHLKSNQYLELSVRSSTPLKHWLILANGVGIIDADYYNNKSNEGEIYLQLINLSPFNLKVQKGEAIGQGIIKHYLITENDVAGGERTGGFGSTSE